jgi:type II secretory pathway component GspD/PulD (secretin)
MRSLASEEIAESSPAESIQQGETKGEDPIAFSLFKSSKDKQNEPVVSPPDDGGYMINYNTVSMLEYVRFASKICNVNFLFEDQDLNFTVTVVSKEPITPENVMATLIQILRIHGLYILEQDGNLVIHKNEEVKQLAKVVTEANQEKSSALVTRIFRLQNAKPESLSPIIRSMISSTAILETSAETRQLILTDIKANVDKVATLIDGLDSPHTTLIIRNFAAQFNSPEYLVELVGQLMNPIAQGNSFHLVPAPLSNNVYVVSTPELANRSIEILTSLDLPQKKLVSGERQLKSENIFVYKLEHRTGKEILAGLRGIGKNLEETGIPDADLIETINTAKWIQETNSIMIVGAVNSLNKTKEFIQALDVPTMEETMREPKVKYSFYVYKFTGPDPNQFENSLRSFAKNLDKTNAADEGLVNTIGGMKYIKETSSFLFTGPESTLQRLQEILASFYEGVTAPSSQFLNYKPIQQKGPQLLSALKDLTEHLKSDRLGDPMLLRSLETAKWVPSTETILISGDPGSLQKVKELIATLDVSSGAKTGYYIYKLQNAPGEKVEEDLDALVKNFHTAGLKDTKIIDVINDMRYVKETNSLLLSGDPTAIDEVKELIAKYDYPRETVNKSNFYMYKPQHLRATNIEKSLRDIGKSLTSAGLADPSLLTSINSVKYVESTNSLIFTGPPDALAKIDALVKELDIAPEKAPIQHVGAKTFLLYKLKNATGHKILSAIKEMTADLKKSGTSDKAFLNALSSGKFMPDTNSLMFTGEDEALQKVEILLERFDVTGFGMTETPKPTTPTSASNFFVYKPQAISGPELEKLMHDFAENLKQSGLSDADLFRAISSMRWVEKTQSLLFTGSPKALDQVKELLKDFDIAGNLPIDTSEANRGQTIQAIDNTSFLVYKLQFHKGDEIQGALRQIGKDLTLSNAPVNQNLLNSIHSIQWLEVTNSLLCSGDQETLTRLRELIKNLDIPLKQVFIEILVIQTSLSNALTFGLEWGAQYKYRNKFATQINNISPASGTAAADPLLSGLSNVTPTNPPVPSDVNIIGPGFDLGIIGEVIRHGGDTYLTIGSLMAALQVDSETTIVMTPKILTQDGRTSSIFQGSNIPFAGSFISNNSATAGANATIGTTNIEYRDIGVNLTITPVLGNSDIVSLDISLDQTQQLAGAQNQQITFNTNGLPSNLNGITTSKVSMQTTVHVPDDHFLILSGMVNNSTAKLKTGIPCLGSLPLIGAAFSQDNTSINNNSVVIFLRPHIIASLEDMNHITKHEESFFRDQASTPFLEHSFNDAMEMIKTVDDE